MSLREFYFYMVDVARIENHIDSLCPLTQENNTFMIGDKYGRHAMLYVDRTNGSVLTLVALGEVRGISQLLLSANL